MLGTIARASDRPGVQADVRFRAVRRSMWWPSDPASLRRW